MKQVFVFTLVNILSMPFLGVLLKGFFSFYEKFDFRSSVITLLQREDASKSLMIETSNDKDWPVYLENPLVPSMNASKNLLESEGERFRTSCAQASKILSESSTTLVSLFENCRQSLPSDLAARAYPAPIEIMPNLETDITEDEFSPTSEPNDQPIFSSGHHDRINSTD